MGTVRGRRWWLAARLVVMVRKEGAEASQQPASRLARSTRAPPISPRGRAFRPCAWLHTKDRGLLAVVTKGNNGAKAKEMLFQQGATHTHMKQSLVAMNIVLLTSRIGHGERKKRAIGPRARRREGESDEEGIRQVEEIEEDQLRLGCWTQRHRTAGLCCFRGRAAGRKLAAWTDEPLLTGGGSRGSGGDVCDVGAR